MQSEIGMERLIAEYQLELDDWLIIKWPERQPVCLMTHIDGFDLTVTLVSGYGPGRRGKAERIGTWGYRFIKVEVSKPEQEEPPLPTQTKEGRDFSLRRPYFEARKSAYGQVAAIAVKRLLLFFRYRLRQPIPVNVEFERTEFLNPKWKDEAGLEYETSSGHFVLKALPGFGIEGFGERPLSKNSIGRLQQALARTIRPTLAEEFLAEAQVSACEGNYRRAVIDLAISCELAIKAKFSRGAAATRTLEYIDDQQSGKIRPLAYLEAVAIYAFGKSFNSDPHKADFESIDYLFRCRNKIVHRGKAVYRDSQKNLQKLDRVTLQSWWQSVLALHEWLRKLSVK